MLCMCRPASDSRSFPPILLSSPHLLMCEKRVNITSHHVRRSGVPEKKTALLSLFPFSPFFSFPSSASLSLHVIRKCRHTHTHSLSSHTRRMRQNDSTAKERKGRRGPSVATPESQSRRKVVKREKNGIHLISHPVSGIAVCL